MSEIKLSRAQRRQMQKLTDKVDRAAEADRLFLERFPHRQYRVRITSRAEIARQELIDGRPMTIPPGYRSFMAVHNVSPDPRMCLYLRNLEGAGTDLEARLRKAARIGT